MIEHLEGYNIVSTHVIAVKNDVGVYQDFEVTLYRNDEGKEIMTCDPYIEMPHKKPSGIFIPLTYKVTNT